METRSTVVVFVLENIVFHNIKFSDCLVNFDFLLKSYFDVTDLFVFDFMGQTTREYLEN